jgi:signal transduction histidine kinase
MSEIGGAAHPAAVGRLRAAGLGMVVALAAVAAVGALLGARLAGQRDVGQHWWLIAFLIVGLVDVATGSALMTRLGHRRLAWCLLVCGAAAVVVVLLATGSGGYRIDAATGWADLRATGSWARTLATGVLVALVPWELAMRGGRRLFQAVWWITAALVAATAIGDAAGVRTPGIDIVDVATWLVAVSATAATVLLVHQWWSSRDRTDDALLGWLAAGAAVAWLAVVPDRVGLDGWGLPGSAVLGPLLLVATIPLLVVGVLVRAMRDRPGRFQGVAHDVIGWLVLSAAIIVVYTVVVAGLGGYLGGDGPMWLLVATTGAIAISVEPARRRVRRTVDRLVWGARDDPLEVVRSIIDHVGVDSDGELLPALAASLRDELRLDAVAIDVRAVDGWRRVASIGATTSSQRTIDLEQHGEVVGRLVVGWEHAPHVRTRDERVLAELAGPLALAVGWVRLANDLRRSTVAVASAREEERRRLRRDLHDGLGPALTGVALGVRSAVRQLDRSNDPQALTSTRELLTHAADEVDALVGEVKRIVRDLRPTSLDRFGLLDAIRQFTRNLDGELTIHLEFPDPLDELPAAVEVALYRIATEAVTNVTRHAFARNCWLTIKTGRTIELDIVDDGIGPGDGDGDGDADGVGRTAMRERAAELGGTVQIHEQRPHGTRVHVRLPSVAM